MRTIPYSALKSDLFTPWVRASYFSNGEAERTSSLCAELSRLAYCRKPPSPSFDTGTIQSVLIGIGFSQARFFESDGTGSKGGTHGFSAVGTDPDSGKQIALVVFRGTDANDPRDIVDDADIVPKHWEPGGWVHTGFANALSQVRPALDDAVNSIGLPILFTGHSLGAALATLAASLYRPSVKEGSTLRTIGSPRVGDAEFAATLDGMEVYRYVDCCDVVTTVPPKVGYVHVGPARYIDRNGIMTLDPPETVIAKDRFSARLFYLLKYAWRPGNVGFRGLADHTPMNYVWPLTQN